MAESDKMRALIREVAQLQQQGVRAVRGVSHHGHCGAGCRVRGGRWGGVQGDGAAP